MTHWFLFPVWSSAFHLFPSFIPDPRRGQTHATGSHFVIPHNCHSCHKWQLCVCCHLMPNRDTRGVVFPIKTKPLTLARKNTYRFPSGAFWSGTNVSLSRSLSIFLHHWLVLSVFPKSRCSVPPTMLGGWTQKEEVVSRTRRCWRVRFPDEADCLHRAVSPAPGVSVLTLWSGEAADSELTAPALSMATPWSGGREDLEMKMAESHAQWAMPCPCLKDQHPG